MRGIHEVIDLVEERADPCLVVHMLTRIDNDLAEVFDLGRAAGELITDIAVALGLGPEGTGGQILAAIEALKEAR